MYKIKETINKPNENNNYINEIAFFSYDEKHLSSNDLKFIDKGDNNFNNKYILYYIPKSEKINVFSIKEKKLFLCDYEMENKNINDIFSIKYILDSDNFKTISANNSLYIIGPYSECDRKIRDMIKKKVCKISYNPIDNICLIKIINETNFNRKNCSLIFCKYFNIIICVGGSGMGYLDSSEFLDLSKEYQGWINFKKKTNNAVINEKLYILNDTKFF